MDQMKIEILDDETFSIETGTISEKNHCSAEEFLEMIEELAGSPRKTTQRKIPYSMQLRSKDRLVKTFQK